MCTVKELVLMEAVDERRDPTHLVVMVIELGVRCVVIRTELEYMREGREDK